MLSRLRRAANLRLPFPERKVNVTKERQSVQDLDAPTRQAIEAANALDLRVYAELKG